MRARLHRHVVSPKVRRAGQRHLREHLGFRVEVRDLRVLGFIGPASPPPAPGGRRIIIVRLRRARGQGSEPKERRAGKRTAAQEGARTRSKRKAER